MISPYKFTNEAGRAPNSPFAVCHLTSPVLGTWKGGVAQKGRPILLCVHPSKEHRAQVTGSGLSNHKHPGALWPQGSLPFRSPSASAAQTAGDDGSARRQDCVCFVWFVSEAPRVPGLASGSSVAHLPSAITLVSIKVSRSCLSLGRDVV